MRFSSPFALFLILLLPLFIALGWPTRGESRRREAASLLIRLVLALCLILSLSGLEVARAGRGNPLSVVFLVDGSDSMSNAAREESFQFVQKSIQSMAADDQAAVVVFGRDALVERPMSNSREIVPFASVPDRGATNIARAMQLGLALFPADTARKMVLLTDGVSTSGNPTVAARVVGDSNVELLAGNLSSTKTDGQPEVILRSMQVPNRLRQGDSFDVNLTVESTQPTTSTLSLFSNGELVYSGALSLQAGEQTFNIPLTAKSTGFTDYKALLTAPGEADTYYQNNQLTAYAQVSGTPTILLVAPQTGEQLPGGDVRPDETTILENVLMHLSSGNGQAGFQVKKIRPVEMPSELVNLAEYAAVILVDVPASQLKKAQMESLRLYVGELGGGLIAIGGPTSFGVGGYYRTDLEQVLPVEMQIKDEQRRPSLALVFIIDHSGSMADTSGGASKLDLAKEAVIRSLDLLAPGDRVGVIAFDDQASWVSEIAPLDNPGKVKNAVATLRPGGGTDILAGLQAMARVLPDDPAVNKHVILLTDGGADPTNIPDLVKDLYDNKGITLTTIGVGRDAAPFLPELAKLGGGRYHFAASPSQIPQIYAEETALATRAYIVEESFYPELTSNAPLVRDLGITSTPPLLGYVASTAKTESQVLLQSPKGDPILAVWNYGLGKAVAFTSDATGRWAKEWMIDAQTAQIRKEFGVFWQGLVRYVIGNPAVSALDISVNSPQSATDGLVDVTVDAINPDSSPGEGRQFLNGYTMKATVIGPQGETQDINLSQVAPGRYSGKFLPSDTGAYLLHVLGNPPDTSLPAVSDSFGWVLAYSPEYSQLQSDPDALLRLAAEAKTPRDPFISPDQVFLHNLVAPRAEQPAWPWLMLLAAFLLPVDIAVRRLLITRSDIARAWKAVTRRSSARQVSETPARRQHMESLFQAKKQAGQRTQPARQDLPPSQVTQAGKEKETGDRPVVQETQGPKPTEQAKHGEGESSVSQLLKSKRDRDKR